MDFENQVEQKGLEIFRLMQSHTQSVFDKDWWYGRIMEWSMKNEDFKIKMFRFVDVLPSLKSSQEVVRHFKEYLSNEDGSLPSLFHFGMGVGQLAPFLMAKVIRKNISQIARVFIAGESPQDAIPQIKKARLKNLTSSINLLGEVTLSEKEALDYQKKYIDLIHQLSSASQSWAYSSQTDINPQFPKVNVSIRLSAIYSQIKLCAWEESKAILKERLRPILQAAKDSNVFVNMDMEHYHLKNLTLEIFKEVTLEPAFKDYPHFGLVIQTYLRDSYNDLSDLLAFAKKRKTPFTIRIVKGAYWDHEVIIAEQHSWPIPVYTQKKETDMNCERCIKLLIDHKDHIKLAIGSHNIRTISLALTYAQTQNLPDIELQMLFGMGESIKYALTQMGLRVREYTPVGELIPGMAYLVRRLLENSSNESFLQSLELSSSQALPKDLLLNPKALTSEETDSLSAASQDKGFENEPILDFSIADHRKKFQQAIDRQKKAHSKSYSLVIDGQHIKTHRVLPNINPSYGTSFGSFYIADTTHADQAVQAAQRAFAKWKNEAVERRADLVRKLADLILQNRYDLAALQTLEVGKPWEEADADITEAIDFCRFYAHHIEKLDKGYWIGGVSGETTCYKYKPRGVVAVISPWNFPLAILTGMVSASVVTGNTVVMKPAEQSSLTAAMLMKMIQQAGFPNGVVNLLPGYGEEVGEHLVCHKHVNLIAFTGSRSVGLNIVKKTSHTFDDQYAVKRSIIEMGGKNAIIIDHSADWDEAIAGVIYSAFGFAGQKCSACSRLIVLEAIYEPFVERLIEGVKSLCQKPADQPDAYLGPVIDEQAFLQIHQTIEKASASSHKAYQAPLIKDSKTFVSSQELGTEGEKKQPEGDGGYFVPPTVFVDVKPDSSLAQNEIFGPVLAVIKAKDLKQAVQIANGTRYGLTGGIYSRSPQNIEYVQQHLEVGNLYINRGITGAMVNRHPFGGLKQSGVGSKTGGPDYLLQFLEPIALTENTTRRGFAPKSPRLESENSGGRPLFKIC